jgi:hypothetical protein
VRVEARRWGDRQGALEEAPLNVRQLRKYLLTSLVQYGDIAAQEESEGGHIAVTAIGVFGPGNKRFGRF